MTDEEKAHKYTDEHGFGSDCNNLTSYDANREIEQAYLAGLNAGRPEWHKVADGDLSEHEVNVLVLYNVQCIDIAHYNYDYKEWHFTDSIVRDVIAWCEIPKYTEE